MAYRKRINPRTNKEEYKVRYYFVRDGKKRDSETGWFNSLEQAEREAKIQKENKEREDRHKVTRRRDKKLVTAYEEFIDYLKELSDQETSNTNKKELHTAKAIHNKHMPNTIQETKIRDIEVVTFKNWLSSINNKDDISGGYIRVCKGNLIKFNCWLSQNGYYIDDQQEEAIDNGIKRTKIKSVKVRNKELAGKRKILTILDIKKITQYYYMDKEYGLGDFRNFYFYTLFLVLFFSGMRVEELTGLQWKFIDLRESEHTISIKNAISAIEDRTHALERTKNGEYRTKNVTSIRTIPIFDCYYQLLIDYKESFRYQYNLTKEETEEAFVFPHILKNNPNDYLRAHYVRKELNTVLNAVGIGHTDLQMFRHSCATFLILPARDGLGYSEEKVKDYFGHQDTEMLTKVYARLTEIQKSERMRQTFGDIFTPKETKDRTEEEKMREELLNRICGNNEEAQLKARRYRIHNQIKKSVSEGKKQYYYRTKDKMIIDEYIKENGKNIEFIEDEE